MISKVTLSHIIVKRVEIDIHHYYILTILPIYMMGLQDFFIPYLTGWKGLLHMYMINWISPFNYDFAIAAIPIQIILLVFYGFRRNLPIRQSSCFWLVMAANLVMTSADIISCEMNEIWTEFPLWVMYAINHAYFMAFIIRGWSLFAYTAESTHAYKSSNILFRVITDLPAFTALVLIVSTPWTSAIYTIAEGSQGALKAFKNSAEKDCF